MQLLLDVIENCVGPLEGEAPLKFANIAVITACDAIAQLRGDATSRVDIYERIATARS